MPRTNEDRPEEYNGWTNRETWNANLWLWNDEGMYHALEEFCQRIGPRTITISPEYQYVRERVHVLAEELPDFIGDMFDPEEIRYKASPLADLISYALVRIDYEELAEHYAEDFPYIDEDDEDDL